MPRVLTIGGGIGGMAFAIHAKQSGIDVEIVELDPHWKVAGAGISITGPTYRALKRLGLIDPVKEAGFFISHGAVICAQDGTPISEVPMKALEPDLPTAGGILRPELHRILAEKVRALGIPVRLGATVKFATDVEDGVIVEFTNGDESRYDAVVGADGVFSPTRAQLFPNAPQPAYTGQYCWRILAERPTYVDRPYFYMGDGVTSGLMPVSDSQMYMWLLENVPERRRIDDTNLAPMLLDLIAPFGGAMNSVRNAITEGTQIISRPLDALIMPLPWHRGRTILLGDSAHATTPHLASGAGIAIEGGMILADLLANSDGIEQAFERYEARRYERCRLVVEESVGIGLMQQNKSSPAELNQRMVRAQAALAQDI